MKFLFLTLVVSVAVAQAQFLPSCADSCVSQLFGTIKCKSNDWNCACGSNQIAMGLTNCAMTCKNLVDQNDVIEFGQNKCTAPATVSQTGFPTTSPTSAASGTSGSGSKASSTLTSSVAAGTTANSNSGSSNSGSSNSGGRGSSPSSSTYSSSNPQSTGTTGTATTSSHASSTSGSKSAGNSLVVKGLGVLIPAGLVVVMFS